MTYRIVRVLASIYYALFFKLEVRGLENIPKEEAAIICANHLSNYDPITIALAAERLPSYLAKSQLFENKLLGKFLLSLDAIPVNREKADMSSFRAVMARLKEGHLVGIFAQGTRVKEGERGEIKAGVALFAVKSGAPVVPCALATKYRLFGRVRVVFGEAIDFSEYKGKKVGSEELGEISNSLMEKVDKLIKEQE